MKRSEPDVMRAEKIIALEKTQLFSSLSGEDLSFLATRCRLVEMSDAMEVFAPRTPAVCLYIVISGSVIIRAEDDRALLAEYVAGDSFGEMEFFTGANWSALARCEGPCRLLAFPGHDLNLHSALKDRPKIAARIMRNFLLVISARIRNANTLVKENSPWVRELKRQVYADKLTALYNQAWLREQLDVPLREGFILLMMKPDNFKEINDTYGHEAGDASLVLIARALESICPPEASIIRYLGNEMAIALPEFKKDEALRFAKKLQKSLAAVDLSSVATGTSSEKLPRLRSSFGIAVYPEHGSSIAELIAACEELPLYARSKGGSLILFPEDKI
jgi:diguanylate cyclase